jgi:phosphoglycolate phosphatase
MEPWTPILFDMDGTLVDSAPAISSRLRETLEHFGVTPPDEAGIRLLIGPPTGSSLLTFVGPDRAHEANTFYNALSKRDGLGHQELFPEVDRLLATLVEAGIPLGVSTSKPQRDAVHTAEHFGIAQFFTALVGSSPTRPTKAAVVGETLAQLQAIAHSPTPVMVGDRSFDIEGAAEHNVPTVLVRWGYAAPEEELAALTGVDTIDDLLTFLLG